MKKNYIISELLNKNNNEIGKLIKGGMDPNAILWDKGNSILKITKMEKFYSEMHINAICQIHKILAPIHVAPRLLYIDYVDGYVISEFEKIIHSGDILTSYEAGNVLGKAHVALKDVEVKKAFSWSGFYGEKSEFSCVVPLVKDVYIRETGYKLLDYITNRKLEGRKSQYIHRDLNPGNIIKSFSYIYLIDWDMTYGGYIEDDVAMSICCLGTLEFGQISSLISHCDEFLRGYRLQNDVDWASRESSILISAIALAGLRQGVSGWFSDKGDLSAAYWDNIRNRMEISLLLCQSSNRHT